MTYVPFFYPINAHNHLKTITNEDTISYLLNKEIIMIPSSPTITFEEQKQVVDVIYRFITYQNNIKIININNENKNEIYNNFLSNIDNSSFRYFDKRTVNCLNNHIITTVLYDNRKNEYIGYAHIDYENKYWIGIYITNEYQNMKLGSFLLDYILQDEKVYNINEINLTVDINNKAALKLYKKKNFKIIDTKDTYYIMKRSK